MYTGINKDELSFGDVNRCVSMTAVHYSSIKYNMFIVTNLIVACAIACSAQGPPEEWVEQISRGDMLFTAKLPDPSLMPSVENGFLGGDVGCAGGLLCDRLYVIERMCEGDGFASVIT